VLHSKTLVSVLMLTLAFVIVYGVFLIVATPQRHDLEVGDIAPTTITATKDIEDTAATEQLREQAAASIVEGATRLDTTITDAVDEKVIAILTEMTQARTDFAAAAESATPAPTPTAAPEESEAGIGALGATAEPEESAGAATPTPTATPAPTAPRESATQRQQAVQDELGTKLAELDVELTSAQIRAVLTASESAFDEMCDVLLTLTRETMEAGVREGQLDERLQALHLQILGRGVNGELLQVCYAVVDATVKENVFIDEEATQEERDRAAASVEPVVYKKGQNIVQAGEVVTAQQLQLLSSLGLLADTQVDAGMLLGLAMLVALMYLTILLYLYQFARDLLQSPKLILLLVTVLLLELALGLVLKQINIYLIPVQMSAIIVAMLLRHRLALTLNIVTGVIAGVISAGSDGILTSSMFQILLMALFGGAAAVYLARRATRRSVLLYAGFAIAAVNFVTTLASGMLTSTNWSSALASAVYSAGGGLLSAVLAVGVMPLMENAFNLVTPQVLLELSMPNQPLLRLLQTEAPGTHHHSLVVANLAEAAADRVGANALLCRVGAYYHDIGKTRRPIFFKENQIDQPNPHDGMDPQVSAAILAAHVRDGLQLADKYKLPREVKDMIAQHHGDSVMAYFYYEAKKAAEAQGREVDIRDFSYDGPKPQSKEAAILMMADTVEAATRTLKDRSRESMSKMIQKLVRDKFESGQLSESPLTFRELTEISDAFIRTLAGIYHERIEYPDLKSLKKPAAPDTGKPEPGKPEPTKPEPAAPEADKPARAGDAKEE
jgi:putative nucleotidyltransferase with HDIG domain